MKLKLYTSWCTQDSKICLNRCEGNKWKVQILVEPYIKQSKLKERAFMLSRLGDIQTQKFSSRAKAYQKVKEVYNFFNDSLSSHFYLTPEAHYYIPDIPGIMLLKNEVNTSSGLEIIGWKITGWGSNLDQKQNYYIQNVLAKENFTTLKESCKALEIFLKG